MGCAISPEQRDAHNKNKEIEKELKKGRENSNMTVKLLLLGAGESGKSTIVKQMRIIHKNGYTSEELEEFKTVIYENIAKFFETLIETAKINNIQMDAEQSQAMEKILEFCSVGNFATIPPDIWKCLKDLWGLTKFSELVEEAEKYHLNPSTKKLVMDMERISCASYTPVDADILLARVKTTGIKELQFSFRDIIFQIFDVGGQRSERKKWVHCFENVNALLFCASMSEYDQTLIEDNTTNRMKESLKLFSSVLNNPWFVNSSIILFLNKTDLLEEKIQHTPLSVCFPEYTGPNTLDEGKEFIRKKYEALNKNKENREIYTYFTCATDTNLIAAAFDAVTDSILKNNLKAYGLY